MDLRTLSRSFDLGLQRFLDEWRNLLRFPSISTDPAHAADCRACAAWLVGHLKHIGFRSRLLPTPSLPVVYGERGGNTAAPTVLFYGHYDVQPADPLDAWDSPPFEPCMRKGRLFARGASDNKGQLFYVLKAAETLIHSGCPIPNIKIVIEGEEESGSSGIRAALRKWRRLLRSDILMVCDTACASDGTPAIILGLRGCVAFTVRISGPIRDLHSGMHGGLAPNPAEALALMIASLRDRRGRIVAPGFLDGLLPPTPAERRLVNRTPIRPNVYRRQTGVPPCMGDMRFTPAERLAFQPSLDINGIHAGYGGSGNKTIIPAQAIAKVSARLAAGQNPNRCLNALIAHLRRRVPRGLKMEISEKGAYGPALRVPPSSPTVRLATAVLRDISRRQPALTWEGASIPVLSRLAQISGGEPLLVGMGLPRDNVHAPNESFSTEQFRRGYLYAGLLLSRLASERRNP